MHKSEDISLERKDGPDKTISVFAILTEVYGTSMLTKCTLLGEPHNKLLFVDTFKNKSLAESNYPLKDIDRLTICPSNSHLICVSGGSFLKLFKV
jgi:hypothetical protein